MNNTGKTALATIVAGLSVGTAKLIYDHRRKKSGTPVTKSKGARQLIRRYDELKNPGIRARRVMKAYKDLPENNQADVLRIVSWILPKNPADLSPELSFQVHANQYLKTLEYLSSRWAYRTKIASKDLGIKPRRMKNLTNALIKQGLLEHTDACNNYVIRPSVGRELSALRPNGYQGIVKPKAFHRKLRNVIASEMFD